MGFYDLNKEERNALVKKIESDIRTGLTNSEPNHFLDYFSHEDTYIRKAAYLAIGKLHKTDEISITVIAAVLEQLSTSTNEKVRQTTINAAGEIGKIDFDTVTHFFDRGLFDKHHSVRNAVIGSIKKMGQKKPKPVLNWAKKYLHHPNKEIRREICHGIELRGRTHPQDILPLLKELENDQTARVKNTLIHVLGQISYKKGCLETVLADLKKWNNKEVVEKALDEIVAIHYRYRNFAFLSQQEAVQIISKRFDNK